MTYIIDIVLLIIIAISVGVSVKKGFVRTVLEFASYIIAIIAASQLGRFLAPKVYEMYFRDGVIRSLQARIGDSSAIDIADQARIALTSIPEEIRAMAEKFGISINEISQQIERVGKAEGSVLDVLADDVAAPIVTSVCKAAIVILATILIIVLLRFLIIFIDHVFDLPVLRTANGALGGLVGFVKGLVMVVFVSVILLFAQSILNNESLSNMMNNSKIVGFMIDLELFHFI